MIRDLSENKLYRKVRNADSNVILISQAAKNANIMVHVTTGIKWKQQFFQLDWLI